MILIVAINANSAFASKIYCGPDIKACPSGDHIRCREYGWCGSNCKDFCSDGKAPILTPSLDDEYSFEQ